jgi:hypothetical protein
MGFTARSADDLRYGQTSLLMGLMPVEYLRPQIEDRAIEVQMALAERGHHRAVAVPDLIVAATAEKSGLTVLHVEDDFDLIAGVTGQPVERLAGDW